MLFLVFILYTCLHKHKGLTKGVIISNTRYFILGVFPTFQHSSKCPCTTIHRYPIFSAGYSVMCKVYTGYCGTSGIEHGLCTCTVDNPLAKARGLSLLTGAQTMLYLSQILGVSNFCVTTLTSTFIHITCINTFGQGFKKDAIRYQCSLY